ncbi:putative membrane protein [Propionispora sp. 2/2-37]|uniref:FecCD family ABC transporter permease n=1 Tax=Propionispora sp. 2/2-37 TaxID=1677858 RepID=UPI0006BB80BB|nr:iron ABC transporter permease [Propionispora sp. 2/2-37]CUH94884.1 putative membrane protein [Propionispora sp. 2/2-37]
MTQLKIQQPLEWKGMVHKKRNFVLLLALLVMAALLSIIIAVCLGTVKIAPGEAYRILLYKMLNVDIGNVATQASAAHMDIIWQLRLPRVVMALIVGAGLAMCGTVMQATVQNPLAEPYILGIAAGASLGATFSILIGGAGGIFLGLGTAFWAFLGALLATVLVMFLSGLGGQMSTVKMVLSGAVISALFGAISNFIIYLSSDAEGMRTVTFWTMGSLAAAKWDNLFIPGLGVGLCCVFFLLQARRLNALLLGEEAAITLGIDLLKIRRLYMVLTALITGIIVSACGIFGFVGLVIPHVVRGVVGADHRRLMPGTILVGAIFLIWADVLARTVLTSGDLPIGIITALIGAPFFMHLLFKRSLNFGSN